MFAFRSLRTARPVLSRPIPRFTSRSISTYTSPIRSSIISRPWLTLSATFFAGATIITTSSFISSAPEKPEDDISDDELDAMIESEIQKVRQEDEQKKEEEEEKSEPRYSWPGRPGITTLCAATIDALVYNPHLDTFMEVYAPGCHWCEKMEVAIDQLAKTIAHVNRKLCEPHSSHHNAEHSFDGQRIIIGVMNGDANYKKRLLTERERMASPVLKFYPAISHGSDALPPTSPPEVLTYNSRGTALAMLRYIYEHGRHKFDLEDAERVLHTFDKETDERLTAVFRRQLDEEAIHEPSIRALALSPCGPLFNAFMEFVDVAKYSSTLTDEQRDTELQTKMNAYHQCTQSAKSKEFWTGLYDMSKTMLDIEDDKGKEKKQESVKEQAATPKE